MPGYPQSVLEYCGVALGPQAVPRVKEAVMETIIIAANIVLLGIPILATTAGRLYATRRA